MKLHLLSKHLKSEFSGTVGENKILDMCKLSAIEEKKRYMQAEHLATEKNQTDIYVSENEVRIIGEKTGQKQDPRTRFRAYENLFSEQERKYLVRNFLAHSSDNVPG